MKVELVKQRELALYLETNTFGRGTLLAGGAAASYHRGMRRIQTIDSHTGGEPTRVVIGGGPDLGGGDLAARAAGLREQFDTFRSAVVNEPRGSDAVVGALLCEPDSPDAAAGVVFFNNVSTLGMCVHGTIGLAVTLRHLGRIGEGTHRLDTPVGPVDVTLHDANRVSVRNVASYRALSKVAVNLPEGQQVVGDIAWGGNWFFLIEDHGQRLELSNVEALTQFTWQIRQALAAQGVTGEDGGEIDHVELFSPVDHDRADSRNFVLCPGKAYDRSPCGTGTSAKVACLAADGKLVPGKIWRQESIVGSVFEATYQPDGDRVIPTITGEAFITAESTLLLDPTDPFAEGIRQ